MTDIHAHRILILDFGSQFTQLIARRVRELGVYCEIHPWDISDADVTAFRPRGIILSGGPESVLQPKAPAAPQAVWDAKVPVLGVCYGGLMVYLEFITLDLTSTRRIILYTFVVVWFLAAPWAIARRTVRWLNGWKQLHVLMYIAYASVITHVWTGVAQMQPAWVQALFWTMVVGVVTSHAIGWVMMLRQYMEHRSQPALPTTAQGQKTYVQVCEASALEEGKGKRFEVNGKAIAIFKHNGTVAAMSATCPHQGGPIEQGKIVDGYVVCPWHQYQFSAADGQGPTEFPDCISFYDTFERNGYIFVALNANSNCRIVDGRAKKTVRQ